MGGLVVLIGILLLSKGKPRNTVEITGESPEARLSQALKAGRPIFAFFHSNNCKSCLEMMALVEQVYPEYEESVELVDVNVYDQQNQRLLQTAGVRVIPTQMFYDEAGERQVVLGLMQPEQLRAALASISKRK